ncbi:MAG: M48 family metalloprotease [Anaerolineae bacterium]|nr:M48 family metalloprotease [Anaerolineae bacterium]
MYRRRRSSGGGGLSKGRILIALVIAAFSVLSYCASKSYNPYTDEEQYVAINKEQEIALGLQAAPEMEQQFGGEDPDQQAQALVDEVCNDLIQANDLQETEYPFECTLLGDDQTINAFALPGGQVYITAALFDQLENVDQLAGVMGHEIGHAVARHSAQQMAKAQLTQGLTGAAVIAAYDPDNPSTQQTAAVAALIGQVINMKFGRDDEIQSDILGVRYMDEAGYNPCEMLTVMEILAQAGGPNRPPEFFSTHPNPENRMENIREAIAETGNSCP